MPVPPRLPSRLVKGDRIGIITVSAPEPHLHPDIYERGYQALSDRGFELLAAPSAQATHGYRAGSETELHDDFYAMLENPTISAVVCSGGGKNANRLLRGLDPARIVAHPKPIVGVSDPSLLLNAITARTGIPTFHGPAVLWDWGSLDAPAHTADHFLSVLSGEPDAARIDAPLTWLRPGTARGHLVAGCLSSLRCLLGTDWEPDWDGAILAWEDAFKPVEVLDQALTHFRDHGVLDRIAGMVVGDLVACEPCGGWSATEMVQDLCADYSFPIATGLPFGHTAVKYTLPIGTTVRLDSAADPALLIESPWVEPSSGGTR
ncbi:S66 peptidase family protein [Streptacidiphilus fuscans]|uniref:LD-carboxypeptidase n=1 Tax=Streptacidiphilus fuscans TaxID=2789292 RepID=A0A931FFQ8_9ACTN|nr:LD-carboxypeptidase [Streptacidiphilus fuscans]MBF9071868.1 LD-carboxypeptidase [Streptacidiphilus fuscans]